MRLEATMGNQVAGLTPPPLVNVEDCLSDMTNTVRFEEELSGSRLFKVAKAKRIDDGSSQLLVLKVFSSPNALQVFSAYRPLVQAYSSTIPGGHNLLSFTVNIAGSERNIVLKRDFIDQSLVDRLCIRPFLCLEEKKWIAFQLLCALEQLHRCTVNVKPEEETATGDSTSKCSGSVNYYPNQPLCHGDIKGENVLLTSWGWLLLTDPAPFKPCQLPIDNPSEFTHYFDSSRRRVCYLAPERFVHAKRLSLDDRAALSGYIREPTLTATLTDLSADYGPNVAVDAEMTNPDSSNSAVGMDRDVMDKREGTSGPQDSSCEVASGSGQSDAWLHSQLMLDPSMDLFSAGCVLLELFTDGSVVFTLADLLNYRNGAHSRLSNLLNQVTCEDAKELIISLLSLDPKARGTAVGHLEEHRGKVFPEVFYSHLMPYMQLFLCPSLANPTVRMSYLRQSLPHFLKAVAPCGQEALQVCAVLISNIIAGALRPVVSTYITQTPNTAAAVGSKDKKKPNIAVYQPYASATKSQPSCAEVRFTDRFLFESGKVDALICLLELYSYIPPSLLLDRVIPYCVDLTGCTHSSEVRSLALDCLVQILQHATQQQLLSTAGSAPLEVFFLTEYLFPTLASLAVDPRPEIRLAYARCLPSLAESALRLLTSSSSKLQRFGTGSRGADATEQVTSEESHIPLSPFTALEFFDAHLSMLRRHIQDWFSDLDQQVRYALMNTRGLAKLVTFFGRSHASGTLLSHMITFLNDKEDAGLRASFYRQISPLISLVGVQSVSVIHPLLDQGLIDPDETVIEACMQALTHLLRQSLLSAPLAVSFLSRALALTAHPTIRLRQSAVAYITCFARRAVRSTNLDNIETTTGASGTVEVKLRPHPNWSDLCGPASVYARLTNAEVSETFFSSPIRSCFTSDLVLLDNLRQPILRGVIDALVSADHSGSLSTAKTVRQEFFKLLQERKASRAVTRSGESPCYTSPNDANVACLFARLCSLGLTEPMEAQLLSLSSLFMHLFETNWDRAAKASTVNVASTGSRHIDPQLATVIAPQARLIDAKQYSAPKSAKRQRSLKPIPTRIDSFALIPIDQFLTTLPQSPIVEYEQTLRNKLHSGSIPRNQSSDPALFERKIFGRGLSWRNTIANTMIMSTDPADTSTNSGATIRRSAMSGVLGSMDGLPNVSDRNSSTSDLRYCSFGTPDFGTTESVPQGSLVAHLHEHQAGTITLAVHGSGRLMASCSTGDGTVKLWNCGLWPVDSDGYLNQTLPTSSSITSDTGSRAGSSSKPAGFTQIYSIPTRSSWTYCTRAADTDAPARVCRGLVWTAAGSQIATIAHGDLIHCVDVATGRQCSLNSLQYDVHGHALCLTASASSQFPAQLTLSSSGFANGGGGDANLIAYATTGNYIVARDLRAPFSGPPAWCLKQAREYGLIRSIAMHSCYTWFVTGTARGHLVSWDLRYERPIACSQLRGYKVPASLLNLQLVESPTKPTRVDSTLKLARGYSTEKSTPDQFGRNGRTLIVAATDFNNGVIVWDLEACASASSAAMAGTQTDNASYYASPMAPVVHAGMVACARSATLAHSPVRSVLCLPLSRSSTVVESHSDTHLSYLPSVIAGGTDGRLRYWNFSKPTESRVLAWSGEEESAPPKLTYNIQPFASSPSRKVPSHGVRSFIEELPVTTGSSSGATPAQSRNTGLLTANPTRIAAAGSTERSKTGKPSSFSNPHDKQSTTFPSEGKLELRQPSGGHRNVISDISLIRASHYLLVSASMDGVIKIWR